MMHHVIAAVAAALVTALSSVSALAQPGAGSSADTAIITDPALIEQLGVDTDFVGFHPLVGGSVLEGPAVSDNTMNAFALSARGGFLYDRFELNVEFSPMTHVVGPYKKDAYTTYTYPVDPVVGLVTSTPHYHPAENHTWPSILFSLNLYGHIRLVNHVSWRMGGGIGVVGVNLGPMGQFRADLVGLSLKYGPLLVDVAAPSFRFHLGTINGEGGYFMDWLFGGGAAYTF